MIISGACYVPLHMFCYHISSGVLVCLWNSIPMILSHHQVLAFQSISQIKQLWTHSNLQRYETSHVCRALKIIMLHTNANSHLLKNMCFFFPFIYFFLRRENICLVNWYAALLPDKFNNHEATFYFSNSICCLNQGCCDIYINLKLFQDNLNVCCMAFVIF